MPGIDSTSLKQTMRGSTGEILQKDQHEIIFVYRGVRKRTRRQKMPLPISLKKPGNQQ